MMKHKRALVAAASSNTHPTLGFTSNVGASSPSPSSPPLDRDEAAASPPPPLPARGSPAPRREGENVDDTLLPGEFFPETGFPEDDALFLVPWPLPVFPVPPRGAPAARSGDHTVDPPPWKQITGEEGEGHACFTACNSSHACIDHAFLLRPSVVPTSYTETLATFRRHKGRGHVVNRAGARAPRGDGGAVGKRPSSRHGEAQNCSFQNPRNENIPHVGEKVLRLERIFTKALVERTRGITTLTPTRDRSASRGCSQNATR